MFISLFAKKTLRTISFKFDTL